MLNKKGELDSGDSPSQAMLVVVAILILLIVVIFVFYGIKKLSVLSP